MVKRPILFIILVFTGAILCAQQSWEGLASVSRFGRFPAGLYGASNLVPPNTLVSVRNLETGLSERIIITDRVGEPGVFLVLSPEAAALLDVSGSGATRVRLTTIVIDTTPMDTVAEQPFHPDPDINPAAGVSLDQQLPEIEIEVEEEPDQIVAAEEPVEEPEPVVIEEAEEPAEEAVVEEPTDEEVAEQPVEEPIAESAVEVTPPADTGRRSGIAAGVARTQVGQAQESFERPDTALEVERPGEVEDELETIEEPAVEPEEVATVGIPALDAAEQPVPEIADQPVPAAVSSVAEEPIVEEPTVDAETVVDVVEPVEIDIAEPAVNPIQEAVSAALNRLPARDYFPAPVGEETDLGFAGVHRPAGDGVDVALLEAEAPPVDRPELAGLAPLQAIPFALPESLAEAVVPPRDIPEYAAFATPDAPAAGLGEQPLPVASLTAEERPVVQDLPAHSAPDIALSPGVLAEATVAAPDRPSGDGVEMVAAPAERLDAELAEAGVAESERPMLTDLDRAGAPGEPALDAVLAEASPAPEERADYAGLGPVAAPEGAAVTSPLAVATVGEEERPVLTDLDRAGAPGEPALEATLAEALIAPEERADYAGLGPVAAPEGAEVTSPLALATVGDEERPVLTDLDRAGAPGEPALAAEMAEAEVAPPESPDSDAVEMVGAPAEVLDPALAEALVGEEERPVLADVGPVETPITDEIAGILAEASPEEIAMADESIVSPVGVPEDALLTLEPADFRPPEVPTADDESLIDRETPDEPPEMVAVLESPEAAEPVAEEVVVEAPSGEPVVQPMDEPSVVEETVAEEPVEVAAVTEAEPAAVAPVPAELPLVAELAASNYYLQIGAYSAPATAQVAVDALGATYPMAVLPIDRQGATVYRVLVGPLEQDETGMLLLWLRAKGYRDTFIRSGAEL